MHLEINDVSYFDSYTIKANNENFVLNEVYVSTDGSELEPLPSFSYDMEGDWVVLENTEYASHDYSVYNIHVAANTTNENREARILITWGSQSFVIYVKQSMAPYSGPIWKDVYYTTPEDKLEYKIKMDGETIFHGKAFKRPDADVLNININKICQNYLDCDLDGDFFSLPNGVLYPNRNAFKKFEIYDKDDNELTYYSFLYDWSYDDFGWNEGMDNEMSHPINNHYSTGMLHLETSYDGYEKRVTTSRWKIDDLGGYGYECRQGDWAIYYLNSYGGWDSFLIEGNFMKTDNIKEHFYNRSFNNTTIEYEQGRYISEIATSYKFNTGWLSDEESENLANNLLGSNHIYLHDLKNDKIIPAVITNTTNEYKTYSNQGGKMVNYEISVKCSQTKIRK